MVDFEIGQNVAVLGMDKVVYGKIVSHQYDEGNVWVVLTDGGNRHECYENEIRPISNKERLMSDVSRAQKKLVDLHDMLDDGVPARLLNKIRNDIYELEDFIFNCNFALDCMEK